MAQGEEAVGQMGADEARATGDEKKRHTANPIMSAKLYRKVAPKS
jgi:hypothetical protein